MAGAFEFDEAAEVAAPGVFAGVRAGGGDGDDAVGGAVEDQGGREFAADGAEEVVFFGGGGIGEAVEAEAVFGGIQDGIEEDEGVGDGVDVREDFFAFERRSEEGGGGRRVRLRRAPCLPLPPPDPLLACPHLIPSHRMNHSG